MSESTLEANLDCPRAFRDFDDLVFSEFYIWYLMYENRVVSGELLSNHRPNSSHECRAVKFGIQTNEACTNYVPKMRQVLFPSGIRSCQCCRDVTVFIKW